MEKIERPGGAYVTRYRLDFEVKIVATEIRIYADADGKFQIPESMRAKCFTGYDSWNRGLFIQYEHHGE